MDARSYMECDITTLRRRVAVLFELMQISAEGGEPQRLGLTMEGLADVRLHPDGQRVALSVTGSNSVEMGDRKTFLPPAQTRKCRCLGASRKLNAVSAQTTANC